MCAAVVQGVNAIYGIGDTTVSNAICQSYTNDGEFNNEVTIVDETGVTVTWRGDDRKTQISVDMIAKTSTMPVLGSSFSVTVNAKSAYPAPAGTASVSFVGWVTKISDKGSNKSFSAVTVTAVGYEKVVTPA
jgi:hypothetical protein